MKNAIMLVSGHIAGVWEFKKSAAFIILSVKPVSKRSRISRKSESYASLTNYQQIN